MIRLGIIFMFVAIAFGLWSCMGGARWTLNRLRDHLDQPCEHGARHPSLCGECRAEKEFGL